MSSTSEHPGYRTSFACTRCGKRHPTNRENQKMCSPCRLITSLRYWSDGHARPSNCRRCSQKMLRAERASSLCADCHTVPEDWICDCVVCGHPGLSQFRRGIPVCKWCVLDPAEGARFALSVKLEGVFPSVAKGGARRPSGPKAVKGTSPPAPVVARTPEKRLWTAVVDKHPLEIKRGTLTGGLRRLVQRETYVTWRATLGPDPTPEQIAQAAEAAPEGWLS